MRSILFAGAALLASNVIAAPDAHAGVYLELINNSDDSGLISGNSSIDVSGLQVGAYTIGAGVVSTTPNNPLALDFANFSTTGSGANPGILQIYVSATDLTVPIGSVINFITQASGNILSGALIGMVVQTYVDTTNAIGGMQYLLSTLTVGAYGVGEQYNQQVAALFDMLTSPFSETFVIDMELASNSDISGDTDLAPQIPEPASYALFGTALLGMYLMRRRFLA